MGTPDPRPAIACTGAAVPPTADGDKVPGRGVVSRCFLTDWRPFRPMELCRSSHGAIRDALEALYVGEARRLRWP